LRGRLQSAHEVARQKLIAKKEKSKEYYDRESKPFDIQTGQRVLLYDETVRRGKIKEIESPIYRPI
jgi:hypothetical protein